MKKSEPGICGKLRSVIPAQAGPHLGAPLRWAGAAARVPAAAAIFSHVHDGVIVNTEIAQLLQVLGHVYASHGQTKRAIALQMIAAWLTPDDPALLRTLAHTFLLDGAPDKALPVIERLRAIEGDDHPGLSLMRSRALKAAGQDQEAREAFLKFIDLRKRRASC